MIYIKHLFQHKTEKSCFASICFLKYVYIWTPQSLPKLLVNLIKYRGL